MDKKISPFTALKYRDFRLAWTGIFISQIGSEMLTVAVNWQIYLMTKSPLSLGIIGAARFLPLLFLSLFSGLVADKFNRKKIIFAAQLVLIFSSVCLAYLTFSRHITPVYVYGLLALNASALAFSNPARNSLMPNIVPREHFVQAVGLISLMWQTSMIIGPAIGGFIIGFLGVGYIYVISIFMFMGVNLAMLLMKPVPHTTAKPDMSLRSIRQGLSFVKRSPLIWSTMLLDFFATFFAASTTLMPIFAQDILKVGPLGLGFLYAAPSVGAILTGLIFSSYRHVRNQGKILVVSVFVYGVATILFGLSHVYALSLLCLLFVGGSDAISSIIRNTVRQLMTPDHLRGRMVSVNMIFYTGGPYLGEVEAGFAATLIGTPLSVVFGGVGTLVATAIMVLAVPTLLAYDSHHELS